MHRDSHVVLSGGRAQALHGPRPARWHLRILLSRRSLQPRDWYFDHGGIYLSRESRAPYFALKQALPEIIDRRELENHPDMRLDAKWIASVQQAGTRLREALSNDIGTRRQSCV